MKMRRFIHLSIVSLVASLGALGSANAQYDVQRNFSVNGEVSGTRGFNYDNGNVATGNDTCRVPAQVSTAGTDTTPVATTVYIAQINTNAAVQVTGIAIFNGTVASGNVKVGLADSAGLIIATSASTAMAGTDAYQLVPFTASVRLTGPTVYYVLLFVDNTTARFNTHTLAGTCRTGTQTAQVFATGFTTITPPTTFTTGVGPIASFY